MINIQLPEGLFNMEGQHQLNRAIEFTDNAFQEFAKVLLIPAGLIILGGVAIYSIFNTLTDSDGLLGGFDIIKKAIKAPGAIAGGISGAAKAGGGFIGSIGGGIAQGLDNLW